MTGDIAGCYSWCEVNLTIGDCQRGVAHNQSQSLMSPLTGLCWRAFSIMTTFSNQNWRLIDKSPALGGETVFKAVVPADSCSHSPPKTEDKFNYDWFARLINDERSANSITRPPATFIICNYIAAAFNSGSANAALGWIYVIIPYNCSALQVVVRIINKIWAIEVATGWFISKVIWYCRRPFIIC